MARAHLYMPITTSNGDIIAPIIIRLLEPNSTTEISETVYTAASGTSEYDNAGFLNNDGVVDVYLDEPRRVRLGITPPGQNEMFLDDIDISTDAVVYAPLPLKITNSPSTIGHVLKVTGATTLAFGAAPSGGGGGGGGTAGALSVTTAELDDLMSGDGLVVGQAYLWTEGPTIGVPQRTSPTQLLMWAVEQYTFALGVLVYAVDFGGQAWPGMYDYGTGRWHELRDHFGNVVSEATGTNSELISDQFPWGYNRVRGNRVAAGGINTSTFLTGWGAAADAGAFIMDNDISAVWDDSASYPTTCNLSGLIATGPNYCTFRGNTVHQGAQFKVPATMPDGARFINNVVRSGFRLNINPTAPSTMSVIGCEFDGRGLTGSADNFQVTANNIALELRNSRFHAVAGNYAQYDVDGNGGSLEITDSEFLGDSSLFRDSANECNVEIVSSQIYTGTVTVTGAGTSPAWLRESSVARGTVHLVSGSEVESSRFAAGATFYADAFSHSNVVIEGAFTETATANNTNTLKNKAFDDIV